MKDEYNFNPEAWQAPDEKPEATKATPQPAQQSATDNAATDVEIITQRIESAGVDIAPQYDTWRDVGFALSSEFGEAGRSIFLRISKLHAGCTDAAANDQYNKCLHAHGSGITIKTFFETARKAGIDIRTRLVISPISPKSPKSPQKKTGENGNIGENGDSEHVALPTFSNQVLNNLPEYLMEVASYGRNAKEMDIMLLSAIAVISGCLPNIQGVYDDRTVYANLFFFVSARAGSGKGRADLCRLIAYPIHRRLKDSHKNQMTLYEANLAQWEATPKKSRGPKPQKPPQTMLYIPADISATAFTQLLSENGGRAIIFDTEADGLADSFESDFGDFSKTFRASFHHETVGYHRRTGDEDVEIENPQISAFLTGTPKQVVRLIKDPENGLCSRFGYYRLETELIWRSVLGNQRKETLDDKFRELGDKFTEFYDQLCKQGTIQFSVTEEQNTQFDAYFSELMQEYYRIFKDDILGSVFRLGLICYRICMVLSAVRIMETGDFSPVLICLDEDFQTAMTISRTLAVHMAKIFDELTSTDFSRTATVAKSARRQRFLAALPGEFDRQDYLEAAEHVGVPQDTADKWIRAFCAPDGPIEKIDHGQYKKK